MVVFYSLSLLYCMSCNRSRRAAADTDKARENSPPFKVAADIGLKKFT